MEMIFDLPVATYVLSDSQPDVILMHRYLCFVVRGCVVISTVWYQIPYIQVTNKETQIASVITEIIVLDYQLGVIWCNKKANIFKNIN